MWSIYFNQLYQSWLRHLELAIFPWHLELQKNFCLKALAVISLAAGTTATPCEALAPSLALGIGCSPEGSTLAGVYL